MTFKTCLICGLKPVERHHIFFGRAFRNKSEKYHMTVCLCAMHHRDNELGVHGKNKKLDIKLKRIAQKLFIKKYGNEEFLKIFKKNYL